MNQSLRESDFIFSKFLSYLGNLKIKNSGYPEEVQTEEEKLKYCEQINCEMNYEEECLKLKPDDIQFNSVQRSLTKTALNSILGKMSQGISLISKNFSNSRIFFSLLLLRRFQSNEQSIHRQSRRTGSSHNSSQHENCGSDANKFKNLTDSKQKKRRL